MDSLPRRAPFSISEFGQLVASALEWQEPFDPALDFAFMDGRFSESRFSLDTVESEPKQRFLNDGPAPRHKLLRSLRALVTGKRAPDAPYRSPFIVDTNVDAFTQSTHSSAFVPYGMPYHDGLEHYPPPSPTLFARSSLDSDDSDDHRASLRSGASPGSESACAGSSSSECAHTSAEAISSLFFAPGDTDVPRRAHSDIGHGSEERAAAFDADPFAKDSVQIVMRTPPRRPGRPPRGTPPPPRPLQKKSRHPRTPPAVCPMPGMPHGGCGDWTLGLPLPTPKPLEEVHARADVNAALNMPSSRWFPSPPPSPSPRARRRGVRPSTSSGALSSSASLQSPTSSRVPRPSTSSGALRPSYVGLSPSSMRRRPSATSSKSTTSSKKRVAFAEGVTPLEELMMREAPLDRLVQGLVLEGDRPRKIEEKRYSLDVPSLIEDASSSVGSISLFAEDAPSSVFEDGDSVCRPDSPFPLLDTRRSKLQSESICPGTPASSTESYYTARSCFDD